MAFTLNELKNSIELKNKSKYNHETLNFTFSEIQLYYILNSIDKKNTVLKLLNTLTIGMEDILINSIIQSGSNDDDKHKILISNIKNLYELK